MIYSLKKITTATANRTKTTLVNPNAKIIYHISDIILQTHSDAAYLAEPNPAANPINTTFLILLNASNLMVHFLSLSGISKIS